MITTTRIPPRPEGSGPERVLLYSHDSYGLGHLRRSTTIATALLEAFPEAEVLIATGSPCATQFPTPHGIEIVKLPCVTKNEDGRYIPRSLGTDLSRVVELRRNLLLELQRSFRPDLVVVDHQVVGMQGELDKLLEEARRMGTRTLLGVRDIIDSPEVVAREWGTTEARKALCNYDRVCVYGTPEIFDPRVEYPIPPELSERLEFTGYVARPLQLARPRALPQLRPEVLVTVGGGQDGGERVETLMESLELGPVRWNTTVVLGPLFGQERSRQVKRRAKLLDRVRVHQFHANLPHLLSRSNAVVSMAGYNSVVEILQSGLPAILWPRSFPRREQLLRAQRLEGLKLARCIDPVHPQELRKAIEQALENGRQNRWTPSLKGAQRVCEIAAELCSPSYVSQGREERKVAR